MLDCDSSHPWSLQEGRDPSLPGHRLRGYIHVSHCGERSALLTRRVADAVMNVEFEIHTCELIRPSSKSDCHIDVCLQFELIQNTHQALFV